MLAALAMTWLAGNAAALRANPPAPGAHIASNQSVSLEDTTKLTADNAEAGVAPPAAAVEAEPAGPAVEPAADFDGEVPAAGSTNQADSDASTGDRRIVGPASRASPSGAARSASAMDRLGRVGQPVPWYRSTFGALAIVLGVVAASYWLVRRFVPAARVSESGVLQVVARAGLTPKQSVALVRLPRRFVLVGVSAERVETLCSIDEPEEVADLLTRVHTPAGAQRFGSLLQDEAGSYGDPASLEDEDEAGATPGTNAGVAGLVGKLQRLRGRLTGS